MNNGFILIPVHNRRAFTLGCLAVLRANGDLADCGAIVVDDGSSDGTGEAVIAEFPEVIVVRGDGTLFWTGAIRLAMQTAAARGPGPFFWLNDDCRPRPGALRALRLFLEKNPAALAGPRCVDAATGGAVPTGFVGRRTFAPAAGEMRAVQGLSGFCVGVGADAAARIGPPDAERFPHYGGDTAYTLRASRAGCPVFQLGDAIVELIDHAGGARGLRAQVQPEKSLAENWRKIFAATASPYRLRTLFALLRLKYGPLTGSALAAARAAGWMAQLGWTVFRGPVRDCKIGRGA